MQPHILPGTLNKSLFQAISKPSTPWHHDRHSRRQPDSQWTQLMLYIPKVRRSCKHDEDARRCAWSAWDLTISRCVFECVIPANTLWYSDSCGDGGNPAGSWWEIPLPRNPPSKRHSCQKMQAHAGTAAMQSQIYTLYIAPSDTLINKTPTHTLSAPPVTLDKQSPQFCLTQVRPHWKSPLNLLVKQCICSSETSPTPCTCNQWAHYAQPYSSSHAYANWARRHAVLWHSRLEIPMLFVRLFVTSIQESFMSWHGPLPLQQGGSSP